MKNPPSPEQLHEARVYLQSHPDVARNLHRCGISLEQFAVSGASARQTLTERNAAEGKAAPTSLAAMQANTIAQLDRYLAERGTSQTSDSAAMSERARTEYRRRYG